MAQEGGGGWSRARPVSTAPTSPRPAPAVIGEKALSPRSVSPQRQALGASAPPSTAQPSTAPDPQGAGSRISMGPKRALSPLRDRQFRASVQMEKSEAPPQPAPDLIQAVSTPAAREWLMSSAFGERVAVAPVVQRLLLKFADAKMADEAIWEGSAEVVTLLLSHKAELMAVQSASTEQPIITVHFNVPGLKGANYKAYRVNRAQPTLQTVAQVCKRLNIANPEHFALATMRNVLLSHTETLAAYGLGSLYESWELRLVERPPELRHAEMLRQAIITLSFSSTVPEFNGIKHKHHRVKVDPYAPLWRLIGAVMNRNNFKQPERFCFVTTYEKSDNFILPERECLAALGLGKYYSTLTLKILLKDKCAFPVLRVSSRVAWTQLEESRITVPMARKVISDLDLEVATLGAELADTNARLREAMAASAARLRQDSNVLSARSEETEKQQSEIERLKEEYARLFEEDDTLKFEHQNLLSEQTLLQSQLRKHAAAAADLQAAVESAQKDATLLREQNQSLQSENQQLYVLNGKLQQQIVAQERLNAEYLDRLNAAEKTASGVSQADMEFEMNKLHLRYEEERDKHAADAKEERAKLQQARDELAREVRALQLERERLAADAAAAQAQASGARATVEELQRELQAAKRAHNDETDDLRHRLRMLEGSGPGAAAKSAPAAATTTGGGVATEEMRQAMEEKEREARLRAEEAERRAAEARAESAKAEDERLLRARLQREMSDQAELHTAEKEEFQRRISAAATSNEELSKKLAETRAELQSAQEHVHSLEGQLASVQRKAEEAATAAAAVDFERRLKEETARAEELQAKLAHTRTKYTERIESLQNQHRKLGEEKVALQTTISSLELRIKDLSAMAPQKDGPGYQEDENIDKILLTKLDLKQLVTLINTLARQTNIHLRTFLLHNKGATTPKPKQVERKPRAPAAPKAPPKNIVLAKTVDTSGPLSTNDLEAARTRLKAAQREEEKQPSPDDLAGIFAKQLANRFRSAAQGDVEDLDDSPADFDEDW